jgi:hypothetical protein
MPSPRYTVRLPPALDALVQDHIRASGTPFALVVREALAAYLAHTPPTETLTETPPHVDSGADRPPPRQRQPRPMLRRRGLPRETLQAIAAERTQCGRLSLRAFAQHLHDRAIYSSTAKDGSRWPVTASTLKR